MIAASKNKLTAQTNMKTTPCLPRRQFLAGSALAACALLAPRIYGASRTPSAAAPTTPVNEDDQAIIAVLAAYSSDVSLWSGPEGFYPRATDVDLIERSVKYLVRVSDISRLVTFLNSKSLSSLGEVYAGGPNLAFVVGTTAYTITNYTPEEFSRAGIR
jgi:hypothetical protein